MDHARATEIAARIGQAMAVAFGFIGLFTNPFLIFIDLFVWMGAAQEAGIVQMRSALAGIPVSQIMMTDFHSLLPNEPLSKAVEYTLSGWQRDFPVLEEGRVAGVLTQPDLVAGLTRCGPTADVKKAMQKTFQTVEPTETAEQALTRLQSSDGRFLAVVHNKRLLGIVTVENLGEFLMFQAASQGERRPQSLTRRIPRKEVA
jgi:CBS domain-containing protein